MVKHTPEHKYKTRQEIFNRAVRGLAKQGWKNSLREGTTDRCVYRGPNGMRCALGWSIPNTRYDKKFDGDIGGQEVFHAACDAANIAPDDRTFAGALQSVHDSVYSAAPMRERMMEFAKIHNLTWPKGY